MPLRVIRGTWIKVSGECYDNLTNVLDNIGSRKEIIILGDLNDKTGSRIRHNIVGRHGEMRIHNRERLTEACQQYTLKLLN
jgi:5S rRNA maturation endonuclease (ribonuclease M5)